MTGLTTTTAYDYYVQANCGSGVSSSWAGPFSFSTLCNDIVNIPDANFKAELLANTGINTDGDGEICRNEASAYTGTINVASKNITDLSGIEAFVNLTRLDCSENQLTNLDVSANTALTYLNCSDNQITSLNVSANTALYTLYCIDNQLTSLDVSANTTLDDLRCYNNQLTRLDISANTALTYLDCENNQLTTLDVSANTALTHFYCRDNQLKNLNVANGNNANLAIIYATGNPNLLCIQHDAGFTPSSNWFKDSTASWSETACPCNDPVTIPDANFKALLLANSSINTDGDGEICRSEAEAYTGAIDVSGTSTRVITDLTGIEAFVNIMALSCSSNQLTALDVSANTDLTELYCNNNQLTSLDVSANTDLTEFNCSNNQLTALDVSENTALMGLGCGSNQLTRLDVSANTNLTGLNCSNNQLTGLNVANGNNGTSYYDLSLVNATGNPNLPCIQHDSDFDPTTATNWTKDSTASWSEVPCCNDFVNIPDAIFKDLLLAISSINTDGDGEICRSEAEAYTGSLYIQNKGITDLTGIEAFVNLTELWCNDNQLTSLDVSANTALVQLNCSNTRLTSLDVSANTDLDILLCSDNQLTALDVSTNTALRGLECGSNQLTSLDVSENTNLTGLGCASNQLTSLDVSANTDLNILDCSNNQLASLNVANGNNGAVGPHFDLYEVNATGNEYTCIQHDSDFDPTTAPYWTKADSASWSEDCSSYCFVPSGLSASATTTSADLAWSANGSETTWNIEYGTDGFTQGSGTSLAVTNNPYNLTGLDTGTAYDFYVQANCGTGDTSAWIGPFSFSTPEPMTGEIGIDTDEPKATLDIKGAIRALNRNEDGLLFECSATVEGTMGYDTTDKKMKVCTNISGSYEWKIINFE